MSEPIAYMFNAPHSLADADMRALLGGKGKSLWDLTAGMRLPVPPGFTLTTDACRSYLEKGWSPAFDAAISRHLAEIEAVMGRRFGDGRNPLLLSVRSGGAASMPGMMDTILNVGLNGETVAGFAASNSGDEDFARDCLKRLRESFLKSVGAPPPHGAHAQLRAAVEAVFRSWNSDRALAYRRIENLPDDAGTAVNIQAMVFGNRDDSSGTGVVFSRNPSTGEPGIFGDILFRAQGEDVVSGTRQTISIDQLPRRLPLVGAELGAAMTAIEHYYRDLVDVEFTIESGRLWILQARPGKRTPAAAIRIAHDMANDPAFPVTREEALARVGHLLAKAASHERMPGEQPVLGRSLGASPGLASGMLVTSSESAVQQTAAGHKVILARPETSPEDIEGIAAAAGLLTARGGLASHAAVVARGWGKPAVVGWSEMTVTSSGIVVAGRDIAVGALLSIDGASGEIFQGEVTGVLSAIPEAAAMLAWDRTARTTTVAGAAQPVASDDDLLLLTAIKGLCSRDAMMEIAGLNAEALETRLAVLAEQFDVSVSRFIKPSPAGRARAEAMIAAHRATIGASAARALLMSFHPINDRFKTLVTNWQMRPSDGEAIYNDHSDEAYDAAIMVEMGELHRQLLDWLDAAPAGCPPGLFGDRFARAIGKLRGGDTTFLASPRVDSYHNVWFELHEYLIRLAGMTRADAQAH